MLVRSPAPDHKTPRWLGVAACVLGPILFGVYAVLLDQDANWDLRNYHWYNAYAFLNDRYAQDIEPAHIPTFYNPTLDVPLFLLAQMVPARAVAFILGLLQGLNFVLLYAIALRVFVPLSAARRTVAAVIIAAVGILGGGHLALVGTTFYDNIVSLFVLAAAFIVINGRALDPSPPEDEPAETGWLGLMAAGLAAGAGTGLKLPTAIFAVGLCGALLLVGPSFVRRFGNAFVFGLGVLAGFAVFAGHWTLHLWTMYANPIFPYFNAVFDSPMGLAASYRDTRFVPDNILEAAVFPIVVALNPDQAGEIVFRDWRIAAAFVVLLLTPVVCRWRHTDVGSPQVVARIPALYLTAACGLTYLVWLVLFGIYRYLIPIEMLAPLLAAALIGLWPVSVQAKTKIVAVLLAALAVTTKPGDWSRVPFGDKFIEVAAPDLPNPAQALVLMAGNAPTAWVIPSFPAEASFVRIQGYSNHPDDGDTGINRLVRERIHNHRGDFYMLAATADRAFAQTMLARYGLELQEPTCRAIASNLVNANHATMAELCDVKQKDQSP